MSTITVSGDNDDDRGEYIVMRYDGDDPAAHAALEAIWTFCTYIRRTQPDLADRLINEISKYDMTWRPK